jgi:hypothetical protein
MARELGRHRALAGWYTADEQPASEVDRVFRQYKILRANHPDGITFIAQIGLQGLSRWRDAADVFDAHRYPIAHIPEGQLSPLEKVTLATDAAQAAIERSRPVWTVIQYFPVGAKGHWPTYDELRTMSYMAIVAGAKGLFYWSYGAKGLASVKDPERREELWQRLVKLTREVKSLEPALLSPDAPGVVVNHRPTPDIRVLAKQVGGVRYLFAVNNTPREVAAAFTMAEPPGRIEVVGEGRTLPAAARTFNDAFAPYATHVYVIQAAR